MNLFKRPHTIRGRFILIFLLLMMGTVLMTVLFGNIYIEKYYLKQKEKSFRNFYYEIQSVAGEDGIITNENQLYLQKMCEDYGIEAMFTTSNLAPVFVKGNVDELRYWLICCIFAKEDVDEKSLLGDDAYVINIVDENDNYNVYKTHDNRFNADYLLGFGYFDAGVYFVLKTPIQNITENAAIAGRFYIYVAALAMLLGALALYFIIKKITEPILNITNIAGRMAHMDFTAKYEGSDSSEIGALGESINHMSEQLEKTISELKAANIELKKDIEKKEQIDEMRKEFLSNVSHELKTPIALIQGYAEGLKDGINDDPESNEWYCDVIIDEASKMNTIVKKLLNLNQLEFGNEQLSLEHFDLSALLDGVLGNYNYLFEQKQAKVIVDKPKQLMVWADEFMVEEVVDNYISNALNHLSGKKEISVKAEMIDGCARVSVRNTGEQIPEESLDKVWIKFYKVDKARTREYGGSGIGLSIVKAIMDAHNKPYGVYNNEDGVTFWFELDAKSESAD
ncbi:MAG: HAMP domain-containing protein [Lachnospiraceae bacterium]|nr:HAMP domain-containing protein [Lachnospiraceae bacterium]